MVKCQKPNYIVKHKYKSLAIIHSSEKEVETEQVRVKPPFFFKKVGHFGSSPRKLQRYCSLCQFCQNKSKTHNSFLSKATFFFLDYFLSYKLPDYSLIEPNQKLLGKSAVKTEKPINTEF